MITAGRQVVEQGVKIRLDFLLLFDQSLELLNVLATTTIQKSNHPTFQQSNHPTFQQSNNPTYCIKPKAYSER
jgi:hypothetical protein